MELRSQQNKSRKPRSKSHGRNNSHGGSRSNINPSNVKKSIAAGGQEIVSKSIKPNNMANLDQALAYNAHKPRELPSDNIQTLNVN